MVNPNYSAEKKNPFGHRGTVTDLGLFYGRERELRGLADKIKLGQSVSVFGQRTIGKSSLLYYLAYAKDRWAEWGFDDSFVFVPVDIAKQALLINGDELLPYLVRKAADRMPERPEFDISNPRDASHWLSEVTDKRIVFLLDEFDFVGHIPGIEARHFTYFRSMINLTNLVFVTASRDSLYDLTGTINVLSSPFFNIFHDIKLRHFTDEEMAQMIFGRDNERAEIFGEDDFKRLREMSGGIPMVLSMACYLLYDLRVNQRKVDWKKLERDLAEDTRKDYRYFWDELQENPDQRDLLLKLGREGEPVEITSEEERQVEELEVVGLVVRNANNKLKIVPGLRPVIEDAIRKARHRTGSLSLSGIDTIPLPSQVSRGSLDESDVRIEPAEALIAPPVAPPASYAQPSLENQQSKILNQLLEALAGPRLDNYDGYLCAGLKEGENDQALKWDGRSVSVVSGKEYQLCVWLTPDKPTEAMFDRVEISDGQYAGEVKFQIAIDSDSLRFFPRHQDCLAGLRQASPITTFSCLVGETKTKHQLWVQLFQKNRLIQVLPLQITVEGE
ncbi:MAG: AAA-like domain-containing protein [Acidobacteriota bacterium]|nr:AAA-like domain-containing protein [Acidobacteriota bacterium]